MLLSRAFRAETGADLSYSICLKILFTALGLAFEASEGNSLGLEPEIFQKTGADQKTSPGSATLVMTLQYIWKYRYIPVPGTGTS